jgi:hypothetical protein
LAKVGAAAQDEVRDAYWAIFDPEDLTAVGARPGLGPLTDRLCW